MMRFLPVVVFLLALSLPTIAFAQTRVGVPVDRITPAGMHLVDVEVFDSAQQPVRLAFAETAQGRPTVLVEVLVAPSARDANEQADWNRESTSREMEPISGLGDRASGVASMVTFVRDNIFVSIRSIAGDSVLAAAQRIDRAIRLASSGTPTTRALSVAIRGDNGALSVSGPHLAVEVEATGDAYVRRTASGWTLIRTGAGDYQVRAFGVDRFLRYTSTR